jgi:hypothetical protein
MAVIGINYEGGNYHDEEDNLVEDEIIYEFVYLHTSEKEMIFNSGNFPKDWYDAKKAFITLQEENPNDPNYFHLSGSSTCDHFIMDGAKFDSAYLHVEGETPVLKYCIPYEHPPSIETMVENRSIYEGGWEFFVPEGTKPTWEELKESFK